ncbi:MAG TPA: IS110 family transposase [Actinomycetota bacterium]|nr:IS110 family transposase [Actinomycetota bacterium]
MAQKPRARQTTTTGKGTTSKNTKNAGAPTKRMSKKAKSKKNDVRTIVGGVDTHSRTHHAAVITTHGMRVADKEFPATAAGYRAMLAWLGGFGRLFAVGVEGTNSYGAGLTRHLHTAGVTVLEVNRPDRRQRRDKGKSDPLDAYAAADAVLAQRATATPKLGTGISESIRVLHTTRAGAVKARTATINTLRNMLVTAPTGLREHLDGLSKATLITACAELDTAGDPADPEIGVRLALASLAHRYQHLTSQITALDKTIGALVERAAPQLLKLPGVGRETAAQLIITVGDNPDRITTEAGFAALCGVAPVPASSGKTRRHRLSRGGDRQANRALHLAACSRLRHDPRTQAYKQRRAEEQLTNKDILRCLKRYLAREIYKALMTSTNTTTNQQPTAA